MVCAYKLHPHHDITVFEANNYIGGHTHTVDVTLDQKSYSIDTGFIVFNHKTYPNFTRLLHELNVDSAPTSMSFSVRCDQTGLEYNGTNLNGVFSQRRNLFRPSFHRFLRDIMRFNREAPEFLQQASQEMTVGEYLRENSYSPQFARQYLLPMGAAIWSCPLETFEQFPIAFIIEFYQNHGLLQLRDRPVWRVIQGGSVEYVKKLTASFSDRIRLMTPVDAVTREEHGVSVQTAGGTEHFDEVIFACHSDQALRILRQPDDVEREILEAFPYSKNSVVLHTDASILPKKRRTWAAWNYHLSNDQSRPTLTYNMNILQHVQAKQTFCVTLNEDAEIAPETVLGRYQYSHPIFTTRRAAVQKRHAEVIRRAGVSYCGAWWGNGFHEDGVNSALSVVKRFSEVSTACAETAGAHV